MTDSIMIIMMIMRSCLNEVRMMRRTLPVKFAEKRAELSLAV